MDHFPQIHCALNLESIRQASELLVPKCESLGVAQTRLVIAVTLVGKRRTQASTNFTHREESKRAMITDLASALLCYVFPLVR